MKMLNAFELFELSRFSYHMRENYQINGLKSPVVVFFQVKENEPIK